MLAKCPQEESRWETVDEERTQEEMRKMAMVEKLKIVEEVEEELKKTEE